MRILMVAPGPRFSTYDTFMYYTRAFRQLGNHVATFNYHDNYAYHATALSHIENDGGELTEDQQRDVIMLAGEDLISAIARKTPDLLFVISGLALPQGMWDWFESFRENLKVPFSTMVLFTESPYVDEMQLPILERADMAATMDIGSLGLFKEHNENSIYIGHAHDPAVHKLAVASTEYAADVFMVGTGFPERVKLLSGVDWSGIDLRIFGGNWDDEEDGNGILEYHTPEFLENDTEVVNFYTNSRISLNIFRTAKWPGENVMHIDPASAHSVSPRCYEIMACGGFLLTDERPELKELFSRDKDYVAFDGSEDLQDKILYYLSHPRQREKIATSGYMAVRDHTYVNRAKEILKFTEGKLRRVL